MLDLATITSSATLKLIICRLQGSDEGVNDTELARMIGVSRQSLWRARQELVKLDIQDEEPVFAPETEEDTLFKEAQAIDTAAKFNGRPVSARDRHQMRIRFFAKVWKVTLPEEKPFSQRSVDMVVKTAEANGKEPTTLILNAILVMPDRVAKGKDMSAKYVAGTIRNMANETPPQQQPRANWQPPKKTWEPKPGEAATEEEAREARAAKAREQVAEIRKLMQTAPPRKIGMFDDEEE